MVTDASVYPFSPAIEVLPVVLFSCSYTFLILNMSLTCSQLFFFYYFIVCNRIKKPVLTSLKTIQTHLRVIL